MIGIFGRKAELELNKPVAHQSQQDVPEAPSRELVLSPVDRVSEMLFGLFMALTFVGAVSVAEAGD